MGCGDQAVSGFVAELTGLLAPVQLALVFLDGDTALARAVAREGRGWLQWYTGKLARYGPVPEAGDVAAAVAYLEHERALTLAAARRAGLERDHRRPVDRRAAQPDPARRSAATGKSFATAWRCRGIRKLGSLPRPAWCGSPSAGGLCGSA
jgi:hypothetical protein